MSKLQDIIICQPELTINNIISIKYCFREIVYIFELNMIHLSTNENFDCQKET